MKDHNNGLSNSHYCSIQSLSLKEDTEARFSLESSKMELESVGMLSLSSSSKQTSSQARFLSFSSICSFAPASSLITIMSGIFFMTARLSFFTFSPRKSNLTFRFLPFTLLWSSFVSSGLDTSRAAPRFSSFLSCSRLCSNPAFSLPSAYLAIVVALVARPCIVSPSSPSLLSVREWRVVS